MSKKCRRSFAAPSRYSETPSFVAESLERRLFLSASLTTLYTFPWVATSPEALAITVDGDGNLFGTTSNLINNENNNTIWELAKGNSTPTTLYTFAPNSATFGNNPTSIAVDGNGDLFGTTSLGGASGDGTLWEPPHESSALTLLHSFTASDGGAGGPITIDSNGNLYGTTPTEIWELPSGGTSLQTLYTSSTNNSLSHGIAIDGAGNLYVTNFNVYGITELPKGSSSLTTRYLYGGGPDAGFLFGLASDPLDNLFLASSSGIHGPPGLGYTSELPSGSSTLTKVYGVFNGALVPYGITIGRDGNLFETAPGEDEPGSILEVGPVFGAAAKLVFLQQPTNAFAGIDIKPAITVVVEDSTGNIVANDTSTVSLALPVEPNVPLSSVAAVDGIATFSTVVVDTPGTFTLLASDSSLTGAISNSFTTSTPGWIDTANMNVISGWAYDPTDLSRSTTIEVAISEGPTQTFSADQFRPDLQNVLGLTNQGFTYSTPVLSVGSHTAYIYVVESDGIKVLIATKTLVSQNSLFDEHYYLQTNPDVAAAVAAGKFATGYDHYIKYGQYESRSPSPYWDEAYYLQVNPDVAAAVKAGTVTSGFMHYYLYGQYENRPGPLYFNTTYYLANNGDVAAAVTAGTVTSAFEHFVLYGQYEGRSPMLYFSSAIYDENDPDILPYVTGEPCSSDFEQFIEYGQYEGRVASTYYDEAVYLLDNPDVAAAVKAGEFADGFQHWLEYGQYEGRTATFPPLIIG